ncbi:SPOR domain-containing protein [Methylocapsa polymorpha]|uniref:SPOR domain-containing protein n=1 Tax=Methylocapsa polymorpha TaxID=3080828 RepID=A0ABZ0HRB7_9HYPH|nr:SPOR domain-containing protein [Methylocapsa sp. RX1]
MREPVAKRRPLIDLEEFERRLRQPDSRNRRDDDPLVELARLHGEQADPYRTVFEPPVHHSAEIWDEGEHIGRDERERLEAQENLVGGDFAAIEAGLLGANRQGSASTLAGVDDLSAFMEADGGSDHWRYEDDAALSQPSDGGDDEIRSKRPLYLMAGIIVIGIAGIGASFAFKGSVSGPREIATIRAADGPAKIQPETTASAEVPSEDASILNRSPQPTPVALVNNAEQPVDLSQAAEKAPRGIAYGGARQRSDNGLGGGAASVPVPPPPEPAQPQPRAQTQSEPLSIAALIEPKKVKTVSVRPDGTVLPNDKPPQMPAQGTAQSAQHMAADASKASTPKTTARVATTPKLPPAAGADAGQPAQQGATAAKAKPIQVAEATPGTAKTSEAGGGAFSVQLAAPESEQEARDIQVRLMKKLSNELSGFHPAIRKASIGEKTVYRVRVPNLSHDEATALCQKVQSGGGACFVAKN